MVQPFEIPEIPIISDSAARLGIAYHRWRLLDERLERLRAIAAPEVLVDDFARRRDDALSALLALGWTNKPVRVHHTPYDFEAVTSPPAQRVARRALVLAALSKRAVMDEDGAEEAIVALQGWAEGLEGELEARERRVLAAPPCSLSQGERVMSSWLVEGAAALSWALGCSELPAFDETCRPSEVNAALGLLEPLDQRDEPVLRDRAELVGELERLFAIHWRLVDFRVHPAPKDFEALGLRSSLWFGPLATQGIPTAPASGTGGSDGDGPDLAQDLAAIRDLAIEGKPISGATAAALQRCESIVVERRRALGWACGLADHYMDVPTDT